MSSKMWDYLRSIGADERALPGTPAELLPFACYVPDGGYCIAVIPECLAAEVKGDPDAYVVPIPAKYVIEKGYRIADGYIYCNFPYDDEIGADIPEKYDVFETGGSPTIAYAIEPGKPFTPYVGLSEGARFYIDRSGAMLVASMARPSPREIAEFGVNKPLKVAIFYRKNMLFMLFKFGDLPWMDAPYSPHKASVSPLQYIPEDTGLSILCLLLDSPSGIVKQNPRLISLNAKFTRQFSMTLRDILALPFDAKEYDRKLNEIYAQYSTRDMVRNALATCSIL